MYDQSYGKVIAAITNVPFAGNPAVMYNLIFTSTKVIGIGQLDDHKKAIIMGPDSLQKQEILTNYVDITPERLGSMVAFELDNTAIKSVKIYKNFSNTVFHGAEFSTLDLNTTSFLSSNALWINYKLQETVKSIIRSTPLGSKLIQA